ncbi:MAG TPA: hypothetical protein VG497_11830, partial [Kribbella sp.]|nr:hypothetical protein [Kribbella sp.]
LGRRVEAAEIPEISALGAAELAWTTLGEPTGWAGKRTYRSFDPSEATPRSTLRAQWADALAGVRTR